MILSWLDFEFADLLVLWTSSSAVTCQDAQAHWPCDVDFDEDDGSVSPTLLLLLARLSTDLLLEAEDDILQVLIRCGCLTIQPVDTVEPPSCAS